MHIDACHVSTAFNGSIRDRHEGVGVTHSICRTQNACRKESWEKRTRSRNAVRKGRSLIGRDWRQGTLPVELGLFYVFRKSLWKQAYINLRDICTFIQKIGDNRITCDEGGLEPGGTGSCIGRSTC